MDSGSIGRDGRVAPHTGVSLGAGAHPDNGAPCGGDVSAMALADTLDMLQTARVASRELDARIDCFLLDRVFAGMVGGPRYHWRAMRDLSSTPHQSAPPARWSNDLMALLSLVPDGHNFSLGERDGVRWAWIQPNDDWTPGAHELRHDHPRGSGLVVAYSLPLALASAALIVRVSPGGQRYAAARSDRAA